MTKDEINIEVNNLLSKTYVTNFYWYMTVLYKRLSGEYTDGDPLTEIERREAAKLLGLEIAKRWLKLEK